MPSYQLNLVFEGIDLDDDDLVERLAELPSVEWRSQGLRAFALATVDAVDGLAAVQTVLADIQAKAPGAIPVSADEDFVAISDIATRVGVSREAVRLWANGSRQSNFPSPRGVVGDATKIWAWSDVNEWLRANVDLGDPYLFLSTLEAAQVTEAFRRLQVDSSSMAPSHEHAPALATRH